MSEGIIHTLCGGRIDESYCHFHNRVNFVLGQKLRHVLGVDGVVVQLAVVEVPPRDDVGGVLLHAPEEFVHPLRRQLHLKPYPRPSAVVGGQLVEDVVLIDALLHLQYLPVPHYHRKQVHLLAREDVVLSAAGELDFLVGKRANLQTHYLKPVSVELIHVLHLDVFHYHTGSPPRFILPCRRVPPRSHSRRRTCPRDRSR